MSKCCHRDHCKQYQTKASNNALKGGVARVTSAVASDHFMRSVLDCEAAQIINIGIDTLLVCVVGVILRIPEGIKGVANQAKFTSLRVFAWGAFINRLSCLAIINPCSLRNLGCI